METYRNLGYKYLQQQDFAAAERALLKAVAYEKGDICSLFNLAISYKSQHKIKLALKTYHKLLSIEPSHVDALNNLGNCYKILNQHHQAIKYFLQGLNYAPTSAQLHYNIANTYQELGKLELSIIHYKKSISYNSDFLLAVCQLYHQYQHTCNWQALNSLQHTFKNQLDNIIGEPPFINILRTSNLDINLKNRYRIF